MKFLEFSFSFIEKRIRSRTGREVRLISFTDVGNHIDNVDSNKDQEENHMMVLFTENR